MENSMDMWKVLEEGPPCSSRAVEAFVRFAVAGLTWGMFIGPYEVTKVSQGSTRAILVAKLVGKCGLQCGSFAGIYTAFSCGIERYRRKKDWVNASIAGATTGAIIAARTRNVRQICGLAIQFSALTTSLEYLKPNDSSPYNSI
uniref:Uncharacterized protein n=1 Tax=Picea sitchensis TaxID=3332 RepID=A9NYH8_PICSI|nr:unknown [Picea sitchensis]